jgi:hypothetical protein
VLEDRCGVTVARVVDELAKVGFSDIRKVVTWRPELVAEVQEGGEIATKVWQSRVTVLDSSEIDADTANLPKCKGDSAAAVARIPNTSSRGARPCGGETRAWTTYAPRVTGS